MKKLIIPLFLILTFLCGCAGAKQYEIGYSEAIKEFNWADEDILMSHELKPLDSGAGWKFFVSDIDFDGNPEMLVSFASNGGGNNSLYIYKSENGEVKHYADIIATPKEKLRDIGNIAVKEYANTDIIDAYKNADGNYRYLTTDIASVSGITTVTIYEIDFIEEYAEYKEIARCEFPYSIPEGEEDFLNEYFLSEKCDGKLSEKMNEYMKGYEKTMMPVLASEVSFPRDIVSYTDEEKKEILSELHKDIERCFKNSEKSYSEAIKEFNWVSYDEKPFLYENIFAHECKVFVCDIDEDEIPEIMLTEIYAPREADATEILKFENGEYVSAYGFWGNCYSDEENISFYENQNKDKIMISKTSSYHGGVRNTVVSEVNISSFSYKVLYAKTEYDNGMEKYFIINEEKEITRDFIDGGFSGYAETEKENFETFLNEYENSLTFIKEVPLYDCGFLSLENLPTSDMISDDNFDYEKYIENKDSSESIKKSNDKISEEIMSEISRAYSM